MVILTFGTQPWAYGVIFVSVIIVLVLFGMIMRRKRQLRAKFGPGRIIGPPGERDVHGLHSGRANGRWTMGGRTPNRTAPPVVEGLNEYGEAPPPYAGNDVEMQAPSSATQTAAAGGGDGSRQASAAGVLPVVGATQNQQAGAGLPPTYGETAGVPATVIRPPYVDTTRLETVAEPPPAVLPSYRPSYT